LIPGPGVICRLSKPTFAVNQHFFQHLFDLFMFIWFTCTLERHDELKN